MFCSFIWNAVPFELYTSFKGLYQWRCSLVTGQVNIQQWWNETQTEPQRKREVQLQITAATFPAAECSTHKDAASKEKHTHTVCDSETFHFFKVFVFMKVENSSFIFKLVKIKLHVPSSPDTSSTLKSTLIQQYNKNDHWQQLLFGLILH